MDRDSGAAFAPRPQHYTAGHIRYDAGMAEPLPPFDDAVRVRTDASFADDLDAGDELADLRAEFEILPDPDGRPVRYFCGHSLGLFERAGMERLRRCLR